MDVDGADTPTVARRRRRFRARSVLVRARPSTRQWSIRTHAGTPMAAAIDGGARTRLIASTPRRLRAARTCYDHIAGSLGVSLLDRFGAGRQ